MSTGSPPAGWYPDPEGRPGQRYWDGSQWTEHRHGAEPVVPPPPPSPPAWSAPSTPPASPVPGMPVAPAATGDAAGMIIVALGCVASVVGSLLDWVDFPGPSPSGFNLNAFQKNYPWLLTGADGLDEGTIGHGWFIVVGALLAVGGVAAVASGRRGPGAGLALAGGVLITLVAVLAVIRWESEDVVSAGIDYGFGPFLTLAGGVVILGGAALLARRSASSVV